MEVVFSNIHNLSLPQQCTLEVLASELQRFTTKYLYVVDNTYLNIINTVNEVPRGKRSLESSVGSYYYIRDEDTQQLICCFKEDLRDHLLKPPKLQKIKLIDKTTKKIANENTDKSNYIDMSIPIEVASTIKQIHYLF